MKPLRTPPPPPLTNNFCLYPPSFIDVRDRKILNTEFINVQYIIIQAILSRKSMKKFAVTNEKIFHVYKAFDRRNNSHADMRTSQAQLLEKGCQHGEQDFKNKILS